MLISAHLTVEISHARKVAALRGKTVKTQLWLRCPTTRLFDEAFLPEESLSTQSHNKCVYMHLLITYGHNCTNIMHIMKESTKKVLKNEIKYSVEIEVPTFFLTAKRIVLLDPRGVHAPFWRPWTCPHNNQGFVLNISF